MRNRNLAMRMQNNGNKRALYESIMSKVGKVVKEVLTESEENDIDSPSFYDFIDILDNNGWAYYDDQDVQSKDGRKGVRFALERYPNNGNGIRPVPVETIKDEILAVFPNAVFSEGRHRYAPEIKNMSVILFDI